MRSKAPLLVAALLLVVELTQVHVLSATCPAAPNGMFAEDASGWFNANVFSGTMGNPPGSDQVGPFTANTSEVCVPVFSTCLPIAPSDQCDLSADGYFENGQPTNGVSYLEYYFFSDSNCASFLSTPFFATLPSSTQGVWTRISIGIVTAPATAHSTKIVYEVCAQPGTTLTSYLDNVVSLSVIFADGFEAGNTSAWSTTVG